MRYRNLLTALTIAAATAVILTGPPAAASPTHPLCKAVSIRGDGLNGSTVTTRVIYCSGTVRCVTVTELRPGAGPFTTLVNTCPTVRATRQPIR